jgi:ArsR family transcriptional regulator, arsenate/arsenite/antimonite-responsive transcriptional repressor
VRSAPTAGLGVAAEDAELAALAKALGHPARVAILRLLLERDSCFGGEIFDRLPLAQATVSQHLKVLREADLIRGEIDGARVCYDANRPVLGQAAALLTALAATRSARLG